MGGAGMSNWRFELYEYRQVIHRMLMGEKDRAIARTGLIGRIKCKDVLAVGGKNGWLDPGRPLPNDESLAAVFEKPYNNNPTHESLSLVHVRMSGKGNVGCGVTSVFATTRRDQAVMAWLLQAIRKNKNGERMGSKMPRTKTRGYGVSVTPRLSWWALSGSNRRPTD